MANAPFLLKSKFNSNPLLQQTFHLLPLRSFPIKLSSGDNNAFTLNYSSCKVFKGSPKLRIKCFYLSHKPKEEKCIGGVDNDLEAVVAGSSVNEAIQRSMANVLNALQKPVVTGVLLGLLLLCDHHHGCVALAASGGRMGGRSFSSSRSSSSSSSRPSSSRSSPSSSSKSSSSSSSFSSSSRSSSSSSSRSSSSRSSSSSSSGSSSSSSSRSSSSRSSPSSSSRSSSRSSSSRSYSSSPSSSSAPELSLSVLRGLLSYRSYANVGPAVKVRSSSDADVKPAAKVRSSSDAYVKRAVKVESSSDADVKPAAKVGSSSDADVNPAVKVESSSDADVNPEAKLDGTTFMIILATIILAFYFLSDNDSVLTATEKTSVLKLQVGLSGTGRSLQRDLNRIAETADTSSPQGLSNVLQETALALLRNPEYCISGYSSVDVKRSVEEGEKQFDELSIEERCKFDEETLVNVNNIRKRSASTQRSNGFRNEYIVITIIVAAGGEHKLPPIDSSAKLKEALQKLASIPSSKTMAVEVLWTPQKENDTLTYRELLEDYPLLRPL